MSSGSKPAAAPCMAEAMLPEETVHMKQMWCMSIEAETSRTLNSHMLLAPHANSHLAVGSIAVKQWVVDVI